MGPAPSLLELHSGPWSAIWHQGHNQGREALDLIFLNGEVMGFGSDRNGDFQYSGTYDGSGGIELGKVYTRVTRCVPARMTYTGQWNGRRILGRWMDDRSLTDCGPFRMWPGHGPDPGEVLMKEAEPGQEEELVHVQPTLSPT